MARASEPSPSVTIATDKLIYRRGEPIQVTIRNDSATVVYFEANHASCVVGIYRLTAGEWIPEGICPQTRGTAFLLLAPGGVLIAVLGAIAPPDIQGPIVGGPTTPDVSTQDLRTLPVEPPLPSGPSRERTQGILEPESGLGTASGLLAPGTYRLELKVMLGSIAGRKEVTHSQEFVVIQ